MGNNPGKIIQEELRKTKYSYEIIEKNRNLITKHQFDKIIVDEIGNFNFNVLEYLYTSNQINELFYHHHTYNIKNELLPPISIAIIKYAEHDTNTKILNKPIDKKTFIDYLIDKADINKVGNNNLSPLMYACIYKKLYIVQKLIDSGANINYTIDLPDNKKVTALHLICSEKGHDSNIDNIIKLLVDCGADVNCGKFTPFELACHFRNLEIIKFMFDKGGKINQSLIDTIDECDDDVKLFIKGKTQYKQCPVCRNSTRFHKIYTNGSVIECCVCFEKKENMFAGIECGNIICGDCVEKI